MHRMFALSMFSLMLLAGSAMAQESTAVFELQGIGVDPQTLEAGTHILRNELNATGKFAVIARQEMDAALAEKGTSNDKTGRSHSRCTADAIS